MPVDVLVFAPNVDEAVFADLSASLAKDLKVAVSLGGYYGSERSSPSTWVESLADLVAFADLNHYWAVVKVTLPSIAESARPFTVKKTSDIVIEWAKDLRKRPDQRAKIFLFGSDGKVMKEFDG